MPAPKQKDLPTWIFWLAQDANGAWWGFEVEPLMHESGWYENEVGKYMKICTDLSNKLWSKSLEAVE
jgi:hypothetical protein